MDLSDHKIFVHLLWSLLEGIMNSKWFLLLMTPLFTFANYENDGGADQELYNDALVIEEEASLIDECSDLLADAFYDDLEFPETIIEGSEAITLPVASNGNRQKPGSAPAKRYKDIRQHTNRPKVTHRDSAESKANVQPKRFVFQDDQSEAKSSRQQSFDKEASAAEREPQFEEGFESHEAHSPAQRKTIHKRTSVAKNQQQAEERVEKQAARRQSSQGRVAHKQSSVTKKQPQLEEQTEKQEVRRQPARQPGQRRALRKEAPVAKSQPQVEEQTEKQEVRRQPVRQPGQRRALSKEAPVAKSQPQVEEQTEKQEVRRQPVRQPGQRRALRKEAPVAKSQPQVEEQTEKQEVRRQPVRQPGQRRALRKEAPVAKSQPQVEEQTEKQEVRRQPVRQPGQRRALHKEAPVAKSQPQVEEQAEKQEVRRQPVRQPGQRRALHKEASVAKSQPQVEEQTEKQEVRRQPARQPGQRRALRKDAPVAKSQPQVEEQIKRQSTQQRTARKHSSVATEQGKLGKTAQQKQARPAHQGGVAGRRGQANLRRSIPKSGQTSQEFAEKKSSKQHANRWALPPQEKAQASVGEENLTKNRQRSIQQQRKGLADSRMEKEIDLEEGHVTKSPKALKPQAKGPRSHHSGKRPRS